VQENLSIAKNDMYLKRVALFKFLLLYILVDVLLTYLPKNGNFGTSTFKEISSTACMKAKFTIYTVHSGMISLLPCLSLGLGMTQISNVQDTKLM
jgi:hypothetical protein